MKLLNKSTLILVCCFLIACFSCKKEKEEKILNSGYFSYQGSSYDLSDGIIVSDGPGDIEGTFIKYIFLYSKDFTFVNMDKLRGVGPTLSTTFASPSASQLGAGTYYYRPSSEVFSCGSGAYSTLYDGNQDTGNFIEFIAGTFHVAIESKNNKDVYTIHFDLKDINNESIVGKYYGTLKTN